MLNQTLICNPWSCFPKWWKMVKFTKFWRNLKKSILIWEASFGCIQMDPCWTYNICWWISCSRTDPAKPYCLMTVWYIWKILHFTKHKLLLFSSSFSVRSFVLICDAFWYRFQLHFPVLVPLASNSMFFFNCFYNVFKDGIFMEDGSRSIPSLDAVTLFYDFVHWFTCIFICSI